jgi:hypothetical protein
MQFLGGDEREAVSQIEAHLVAEDAERAGIGAVALPGTAVPHFAEQVEILAQ